MSGGRREVVRDDGAGVTHHRLWIVVSRAVGARCYRRAVRSSDVAEVARLMRESFRAEQLDPGLRRPAVVDVERGFLAVTLSRAEAPEPYRSFRLVDVAALDTVLVVSFTWDDGADDGTVFVLPVDGRDVELDIIDDVAVTTFLNHLLEFTLGGPRDSWESARTTPLGPRLSVVRPWTSGG